VGNYGYLLLAAEWEDLLSLPHGGEGCKWAIPTVLRQQRCWAEVGSQAQQSRQQIQYPQLRV